MRKRAIQSFYAEIGKKPSDVFPLRFVAKSGLAAGITSGKLDGFIVSAFGNTAEDKVESELRNRYRRSIIARARDFANHAISITHFVFLLGGSVHS